MMKKPTPLISFCRTIDVPGLKRRSRKSRAMRFSCRWLSSLKSGTRLQLVGDVGHRGESTPQRDRISRSIAAITSAAFSSPPSRTQCWT